MAFKFPDKDPDERLDYTVDWSRYLTPENLTISSVVWKIEKADGSVITFTEEKSFRNDVLEQDAQANANGAVTNSTAIVVDGVSGTIIVGHLVTGTGIDEVVTVSAVDGVNITVSTAVTIDNDVALTFTAPGLTNALVVTPTNTTTTIVLDRGEANTTYTLICEITTSVSSKTTDRITTNRKVKVKVRERI